MKITVRSAMADVAWEYALKGLKYGDICREPQMLKDGYVAIHPDMLEHFWDEWDNEEHYPHPFGKDAWRRIKEDFEWIESDPQSVHHGVDLPSDGIGMLDIGDFCVILHQMIDDMGWWDWHWEPVAIVVDTED